MSESKKFIRAVTEHMAGTPGQEPEQSGGGMLTIGQILAVIPEPDKGKVMAVLQQPQDVMDAARILRPIFQKYAAALEKMGLLADYAAYALPYHIYAAHQQSGQSPMGGDPLDGDPSLN